MSSFSLRKRFVHMRNKHLDEGALRNVLLEIHGVVKPMTATTKQANVAIKSVMVGIMCVRMWCAHM